jgi:hypothetical protein
MRRAASLVVALLALLAVLAVPAGVAGAGTGGASGPAVPIADGPPTGPPIPVRIALTGEASGGRVLAVWARAAGGGSQMIARPLRFDGTPAGPIQVVDDHGGPEGPTLAWDSRRKRAMLVGIEPDFATRTTVLTTRFAGADGSLIGGEQRIATPPSGSTSQYAYPSEQSVAYDPVSDTYLIAYTEGPPTSPKKQTFKVDIQRVSASGRPIGGPLTRVERRTGRMMSRVVAIPRIGGFLLVYSASSVVRAKPLDPTGVPTSTQGDILVSGAGSAPALNPRVAVDVPTGRYLVTWQERLTENSARFVLRTLGPNARPDGDRREIKGSGVVDAAPDPGSDGWLLAWRADRFRAPRIVAQRTGADGTPAGDQVAVAAGQLWDPTVIALTRPGRFLTTWSVAEANSTPFAPMARPLALR